MTVPRLVGLILMLLFLSACEGWGSAGDVVAEEADGPATLGALQGSGERSPFEGQEVSVHGVVTGNFVTGLDGFFIQDAAGADDGDSRTSDAVYIQWTREQTPKVRRGDRVRVTGKVVELGEGEPTVTALEAQRVQILGRGGVNVTVISEPPEAVEDWARYESMWLRVDAKLTVTGNAGLARFGEIEAVFGGRLFQPTERFPPGSAADQAAADNARRLLVLDDNRRTEYPDKIWILKDGLRQDQPLRAGSELSGVEGVLGHRHGRWRLHLTDEVTVEKQAERPRAPPAVAGARTLRLASVNLLNLFNGNGRGGGFPTPRGAVSTKELQRQLSKSVAMIVQLKPDLLAVSELENDGNDQTSAEAALAKALNDALGSEGDYRPVTVRSGGSGEDVIRVGMFYRESRLRAVGDAVSITEPPFVSGGSRPPLAQAFLTVVGNEPLVVVVNHFKSKGSCPADDQSTHPGDRDSDDLQACWNATRTESARRLDEWLAGDPTGIGTTSVILLGDFNAYAQEDPLRLLRQRGWRDAFEIAGAKDIYSYVHAGAAGRLDHALVSPELARTVAAAHVWHVNADESEAFDYRLEKRQPDWFGEGPWRASDHDPLLIDLDFSRP